MAEAQNLPFEAERVCGWLPEQRWYGSRTHSLSSVELQDAAEVADGLWLTLIQAKLATGAHTTYQLPVSIEGDGQINLDPMSDPRHARTLLRALATAGDIGTECGLFSSRLLGDGFGFDESASVRPMGVEQSNTSIVFGDELVLKLFRRLEPGINPELEILRFLTSQNYEHIVPLYAWYEYESQSLAATLGLVQKFLPGSRDGWAVALEEIPSDPDGFTARVRALGQATASFHNALAKDTGDPAFSPEEPSSEALALLTATIDEEIERRFLRLPDDERLAPIRDRAADVRERLAQRPQFGTSGGRYIRIHGDYHLGQALVSDGRWVLLDFEGEPSRPLYERRRKRTPLRDVAGMLRSFAYACSAVKIQRGLEPPEGIEDRLRAAYLDGYMETIDASLLPAGDSSVRNLLAILELEKAVYELQYELDHRPDWVPIPVAGIVKLLELE